MTSATAQKKTKISSTSINTESAKAQIDCLFLRMSAIYGHIWQSQYRHADFLMLAKQEWQSTLENFSKETVEKAIHACRTHYELPPTLPQFYQLCKQFRPYPPPRGMQRDVKPCSPDVAAKHIARIRQMLKETGIYCQQPSGEKKPC